MGGKLVTPGPTQGIWGFRLETRGLRPEALGERLPRGIILTFAFCILHFTFAFLSPVPCSLSTIPYSPSPLPSSLPICYTRGTMGTRVADCRVFLQEFWRNYHTTGAILPSGRFLGRALARFVAEPSATPRRILEVGPGTGAVTREISTLLGKSDTLSLVELNATFVGHLRQLFQQEPAFQGVASRARVLHSAIEDLPADERYHLIISGLPLNNFAPDDVRRILAVMTGLLEPGGTLSFFEYIGVRRLKGLFCGQAERERLRGVGQAMGGLLADHEFRRDWIWRNTPPAWVHHVRI
jgi:phosphatidylethanolamine/phosphatidyl-N-methylethanolamine N-methyltransferase